MLGQSLCLITILFIPTIYMIHYVPLMFSFPMAGSLPQEMMFLLPMVLACLGMGFVFHTVVTEREAVFVNWVVTSILFLLLSGLIWPRYDMYGVWRVLSDLCPGTWAVEGFVKMNSNGATINAGEPRVLHALDSRRRLADRRILRAALGSGPRNQQECVTRK